MAKKTSRGNKKPRKTADSIKPMAASAATVRHLALAAAAATTRVDFECDSPLALVHLELNQSADITFISKGSMHLPSGKQRLNLQVNTVDGVPFKLTVAKGGTASPIEASTSVTGTWTVTV